MLPAALPLGATPPPLPSTPQFSASCLFCSRLRPDPEIPDAVILETVGVGGTTGRGLGSDSGDEAAGAGKDHSADPASRDGMEERKAIAVVSFGSASLAAEAKDRLDKYEPHRTSPVSVVHFCRVDRVSPTSCVHRYPWHKVEHVKNGRCRRRCS